MGLAPRASQVFSRIGWCCRVQVRPAISSNAPSRYSALRREMWWAYTNSQSQYASAFPRNSLGFPCSKNTWWRTRCSNALPNHLAKALGLSGRSCLNRVPCLQRVPLFCRPTPCWERMPCGGLRLSVFVCCSEILSCIHSESSTRGP